MRLFRNSILAVGLFASATLAIAQDSVPLPNIAMYIWSDKYVCNFFDSFFSKSSSLLSGNPL